MPKSPAATSLTSLRAAAPRPSLMGRLRRIWERTRAINELNELSDEHLKDIGLDRRDIGSALDRELARLRRGDAGWRG